MNYDREKIIRDFKGEGDSTIIDSLFNYVGRKHAVSVAHSTGLVFCSNRNELEGSEWDAFYDSERESEKIYRPESPIMRSRHALIQHTVESILQSNVDIVDIGAGNGVLRKNFSDATRYLAVEPSKICCGQLASEGVEHFNGSVSEFAEVNDYQFDLAILSWALCNTQNSVEALMHTKKIVKPGGVILVAESSRINVPFKKPCYNVFPANSSTVHPWFFSANTLRLLLGVTGFNPIYINRYWDQNDLIVIARKEEVNPEVFGLKDDYLETIDFFNRWVKDDLHWREWLAFGH